MKNIQFLAAIGLTLTLGNVARAETYVKPAAVTVVDIQGEARYSTDGKVWHPLVPGKVLHEGAVIETAIGSTADLVLSGTPVPFREDTSAPDSHDMITVAPDPNVRGFISYKPTAEQNVVRMQPNTMLAIDKLTVVNTGADTIGDTELDLRAGKIFTSVKKVSASSQYIIKLPNGVAGIRGSTGSIGADDSVAWLTGTIIVSFMGSDNQNHVVVVHGGFEYDPQTGQVLHMPKKLIQILSDFGAYSQTLYAQVTSIAHNLSEVYISPTQGIQGQNNNNQGGGGGGGGGGG